MSTSFPTPPEDDSVGLEPVPALNELERERDGRPGVFISYSHRDQEFVQRSVAELQDQDVRVWIDALELGIGDSLIDRISEAIVEEDFLVAVVSEHSIESEWCRKEVATAMTQGTAPDLR